uniref:Secreted protein n=1 Tax=Aegilops tauschii subsp. strangulata TaxID=200361 RepID=A0A453CYH7_AEGTS
MCRWTISFMIHQYAVVYMFVSRCLCMTQACEMQCFFCGLFDGYLCRCRSYLFLVWIHRKLGSFYQVEEYILTCP